MPLSPLSFLFQVLEAKSPQSERLEELNRYIRQSLGAPLEACSECLASRPRQAHEYVEGQAEWSRPTIAMLTASHG